MHLEEIMANPKLFKQSQTPRQETPLVNEIINHCLGELPVTTLPKAFQLGLAEATAETFLVPF